MHIFLFDASALAKRYVPEKGALLVDTLFAGAPQARLTCSILGAAEVAATLVRKRNGGQILPADYAAALVQFESEVLNAAGFVKLPTSNSLVNAAIRLLDRYAINASDAIVLQTALDFAAQLRTGGHDLAVVASDQRLLKAAQAEGLTTFDPETQTQAELTALLGP